jgi:uncharacterized repeat protein (TIGR04138 family)
MPKIDFDHAVSSILARDGRYAPEAFSLVRDSLNNTFQAAAKAQGSEPGHLRGPEILLGFRDHAVKQFGPMVPTILEEWGIRCTRDVGEIVFLLIEEGVYACSPEDRIEDFADVFDFVEAFVVPFRPSEGRSLTC